ncbi:MAG: DinB family protein [Phycisphaerales bacterium]
MARKADPQIEQLIFALDRSFTGKGWHGPALLGSFRGVSARQALATPGGIVHPIWQLVRHAAYWKYAACVRIGAIAPDTFPYAPSNWPTVPASPDEKTWTAERTYLKKVHATLVAALRAMNGAALDRVPAGGRSVSVRRLITGVAAHDAYHTGQIQLIKGLLKR